MGVWSPYPNRGHPRMAPAPPSSADLPERAGHGYMLDLESRMLPDRQADLNPGAAEEKLDDMSHPLADPNLTARF